MLPDHLINDLRYMEIYTGRRFPNLRAGSFRSRMRGPGFDFDEHRAYRAGDDVTFTLRGIDQTGVAGIGVFVLGPNGRLVDDQTLGWIDASVSPLTSGTEKNGIYTVSIKLAATAIPGEYTFLLGYSDTIGNRAWSEVSYVGYPSINVVP